MSKCVILDALIKREDFDVSDSETLTSKNIMSISASDLENENSFTFSIIRKPDFQRETNEWSSKSTYELISSFVEGELIPSIILWKSQANLIFIIDGSHRISALAAWVNDDYGDGRLSRDFYGDNLPEEQLKTAQATRKLINEKIGSYKELKETLKKESDKPEMNRRAKNLGSVALYVQWVGGDAKKAEESFFKINQQGTKISISEIELLRTRKKPRGIATRAILRSGKGHNYWSEFKEDKQKKIEELATEIHQLLFQPEYTTPIKTLDLPIGGRLLGNGMALVFETIKISSNPSSPKQLLDDSTGDETISVLNECNKLVHRIGSTHPSSLGLHPVVYFYSQNGNFKIASYYGIIRFIKHLETHKLYAKFTHVRANFEEALINYSYLVQDISRRYRQADKAAEHLKNFYIALMNLLTSGKTIDEAIKTITKSDGYNFLSAEKGAVGDMEGLDFTTEAKSEVFIRSALSGAQRCSICGGYLSQRSITIDHIIRKQDGGNGNVRNGQLAHPYCNSTLKN